MTNLQLLLTIGVPSFLVVLGWLHQNTRLNDLKADVVRLQNDVNKGFSSVTEQLMHFHNVTGRLEGRIDELSRR